MQINREELAWAAGFFDGEGSSYFCKPNTIRYAIYQMDISPIERFVKAMGNVGTLSRKPNSGLNDNLIYCWYTNAFGEFIFVTGLLWTFLSEPKREQILRTLEKFDKDKKMGRPRGSRNKKRIAV